MPHSIVFMTWIFHCHFVIIYFVSKEYEESAYFHCPMYLFAFCLNLVAIALSDLTCTTGQTYVKFIKKCGSSWASEESYEIYSGSTLLYTGTGFANSETRTTEQCLTTSTNDQYTVKMIDSYGDSWYAGAFLAIYGKHGNIVFKNFLADSREETYTFSLYYGVDKGTTWKMTSGSITDGWTAYSFSDSTWSDATLGSVTATASGTQYFRKQFVGLANMAAYDVRLYYKAGVVAYINGAEVYRDNMPDGPVSASSSATGEYPEIAYRGFIRPGSEVASQQSILAVEVHFFTAQTNVDFNAYLAVLASSTTEGNCFVYADAASVSSTQGSSVANIYDWSRTTSYYSSSLPATVTYSLEGPKAYINSVRVWPYTSTTSSPSTFTWQGSNDNSQWTNVVSVVGGTYESSKYKIFGGYFYASLFSYYRVVIQSSTSYSYIYAYEMQPLTCTTALPTSITFTPNTYTFWAKYEEVYVKPDINEFTSCTAQNLPEGLTIDATTCEITGVVNNAVSGQTITVSSVVLGNTYTGSFTLTIQDCAGTIINVLRTYGSSASYESFEIKDTTTQQVIMSVAANSGQINNEDWTSIACVTGTKYEVSVASTSTYWQYDSFLYVRAVLSNDEMETILRMRYDSNIGFNTIRTFNAHFTILPHSNWYYKHGSVDADWYSSTSTEGWTEGNDSNFAASSNQIQLYKKTFDVADISSIAGFVLSIRFKYGCIVYLNGHEAFRKGLTDATISTSSYADNIYTDTLYHQISLPLKTVEADMSSSVNFIQQGSNTIAIGIIAANSVQTESLFDGALRLMGEESTSRVFDYALTYSTISGYPSSALNHYYSYYISYSSCTNNYLNIAFNNDRHEWINAVTVKLYYTQNTQQVRQFVLKARSGSDEWTTLTNVTGLTWSQTGQALTLYFQNNKAYHEYRFENFGTGDSADCSWKLGTLDLISLYTTMDVPELSYAATTIFKNIEMGEVYPNSAYYYNFQVTPAFPTGIVLNPNTGMISGTATAEMAATTYSITANKLTGGTSTASFSLTVKVCSGEQSLITLVVRTDNYPYEGSYKLFQGAGTSGTLISSNNGFPVSSGLNYVDSCLQNNIYTMQMLDSFGDGWFNPAGYYLTVDVGEMIFEMGQFPAATSSISTMFSSFLPFQVEYTEWTVNYNYVENWNAKDFDDSAWQKSKASAFTSGSGITTYIRKNIEIPDINSYYVLNVRVKYAGGVAAYFNGRLVARFNLEEDFADDTQSIEVHNQDEFSKFHVILTTVNGETGKNVMAFEVHRPIGQSSSSPAVFDATGVFGVNECSVLVDTYSDISGSPVTLVEAESLLDLNPTTYGYQANTQGTRLDWEVENLEGTKFNHFAMQTVYARTGLGFSLYVRDDRNDEYTSALALLSQSTLALQRTAFSVPVGIAGFRQLRYQVDVPASAAVYVSSYMLLYCKPSGTGVCPGIGDYPSVGEGEISPADCERGYRGYSYRTCTNGQLGEINKQYCVQKVPSRITYSARIFNIIIGVNTQIAAPRYNNIIEEFYLAENTFLPAGLVLNAKTGEITGIATEEVALRAYTIYGKNQVGSDSVVINLSVKKGTCKAEGNFETTNVGEVYIYDCAKGGSYVGTEKRACNLGEKDGEWGPVSGYCMPIAMIIILVVVAIIIIVIVAFVLIRVTGRAKAVGGVKGRSARATPSKKSLSKKESTKKAVKV